MKTDWQEVIDRAPRGQFSFRQTEHDTEYAICGTVERIDILQEFVQIHGKWVARIRVDDNGAPYGQWEILNREPDVIIAFLNGVAPYEIEPSPKGDRVRFAEFRMLLYFDEDAAAAELAFTYLESEASTQH